MFKLASLCAGLLMMSSLSHASPVPAAPDADQQIALQMYTLRNVGDAAAQFETAHRAGFRYVELVGDHGLNAQQMNAVLQKNQLRPVSAHVQLAALEQDYANTVAFNKAVGNEMLIVPWLKPEERPDSASGWAAFGQRLDRLGAKLHRDGMRLAYHNHDFEMKKYQGKTALEIIFDHSRAQNLQMEMDAAWVSRGGQDPAQLMKKYPGRIYAIHAKDNAGIGVRDDEKNFAPLGEGLLDWSAIIPAAKSSGVRWYIVEHDAPKDAYAIITTSYKNLKEALNKRN